MIVWGITGNNHDASLAVMEWKVQGLTDHYALRLKWAGMSKDFSGVAGDPTLCPKLMAEVRANPKWAYPAKIYFYEKPLKKTMRQLIAGQGWKWKENNIKKFLAKSGIHNVPIEYIDHHHSHAAYGYYTSSFKNAAVIVLDSIGEFETFTIWHAGEKDRKLRKIYSQGYPHSIGLFYSAMTQRMGLVANRDEYLVSQMANKIDTSENLHLVNDVLETFIQGPLDGRTPGVKFKHNLHRGANWYKPDLTTEYDMDRLANATQFVFEMIIGMQSKWCIENLDSRDLILTGGCALNRDAVDRIRTKWNSIYVPPNPGDPGSCIGAVLALEKKKIDFDPTIWYNSKAQ